MHQDEPSFLNHLTFVRSKLIPEGGISTMLYCGKLKSETELLTILQFHRTVVEQEVNEEEVNITGILIGQVIFFQLNALFLIDAIKISKNEHFF
jgi:hypothetical protein